MGADERPTNLRPEESRQKREDSIMIAALMGIAGAWLGWSLVPSGILQLLGALLLGAFCAAAGGYLARRAK